MFIIPYGVGGAMKGDLHTLKEVCRYGSNAMVAGEVVIGVVLAVLLVLAAGSMLSDDALSALEDLVDVDSGDSPRFAARYLEVLAIFALGFVTVRTVHTVMVSIRDEHSPFTGSNISVVTVLSKAYVAAAVVFAALEAAASGNPAYVLFLFFGCILVSVVLYIFALIVRYGSVLQNEWDHTL